MEYITFKDLNLLSEELRDIIEFIAQKRNVNNYNDKSDVELLSAVKEKSRNLTPKKPPKNLKHKISKNLTPIKPLKNIKSKKSKILTLKKSSIKWSVLAHLGFQPRGQNFQAQT